MADAQTDTPPNVPGDFSVKQDECLAHGCCADEAPRNFILGDAGEARVYKQPETAEEEEQCLKALVSCPMNAIRYSGADPAILKRVDEITAEWAAPSKRWWKIR